MVTNLFEPGKLIVLSSENDSMFLGLRLVDLGGWFVFRCSPLVKYFQFYVYGKSSYALHLTAENAGPYTLCVCYNVL